MSSMSKVMRLHSRLKSTIAFSHCQSEILECSSKSINRRRLSTQSSLFKSFKIIENASIDTKSVAYHDNKLFSESLREKYQDVLKTALAPAHEKALKRHKAQNKLFMEERLSNLLDDRSQFFELSPLAGINMSYGNIPRAGVITGIGKVSGQYCVLLVNDGTIKGGTIYPITLKKQLRCQEIAEQNRLPCIYVIDSGGAFLPLQSEIFPDKNQGGRVFYNIAIMSAKRIPQVAVVVGNCTAGGAYIPMMSDEAVIVHEVGRIFLGGPPLVLAATGEVITAEELGGAMMHSSVSGCTDYFSKTEESAYETCREIVPTLALPHHMTTDGCFDEPSFDPHELYGIIPPADQHTIDMYKVIARVVDGSRFCEFKTLYGTTLITGYAHIHGTLVGVIGNNGELTAQAADKGAHFIKLCSERNIPLIFFQNIHPYDCETSHNQGATGGNKIKCQAKMLAEVACSPVPKVTVVIGNSFGVPAYAMGGKSMGPNFTFLWPNARFGLTDPDSIIQSTQSLDGDLNEKKSARLREKVESETSAIFSSCNMLDDGIVEPHNTRNVIIKCLSIFQHRVPDTPQYDTPIIRM